MSVVLKAPSPVPPYPPSEQEFAFSAEDFERVRRLIHEHAGIHLHANKQAMVYSRLSRRLRETGHRAFAEYLAWLQQARDNERFVHQRATSASASHSNSRGSVMRPRSAEAATV